MKDNIVEKYFPSKVKLGLKYVSKIDKELNFPSKKFLSIHVAGTNGKGSVCQKIANVLKLSGYKVGLYTSPHIISFRERIRINDKNIPLKEVKDILDKIIVICEKFKMKPTFFDVMTALSFFYFAKQKVDIAVIEVGLGGRKDATNVITPILSVITSISFDHTNILGNSIEKIAIEKAGIIKKNVPCVLGPSAFIPPIVKKAKILNSDIFKVSEVLGNYDDENIAIAKESLNVLKKKLKIKKDFEKELLVKPKARMEIFSKDHDVMRNFKKKPYAIIFDVAHNKDGFLKLFKSINMIYPKKPIRVILGMSKDKDIKSCLEIISKNAKTIFLTDEGNERLQKKEIIFSFFKDKLIFKIKKNIKESILSSTEGEILLICGSFFIMKKARKALNI